MAPAGCVGDAIYLRTVDRSLIEGRCHTDFVVSPITWHMAGNEKDDVVRDYFRRGNAARRTKTSKGIRLGVSPPESQTRQ